MATRPKAIIESRNGEKFSPITIAKNVLTNNGQNLHDILSDRKEDMMTPTIENSSSMFKVGQGDNVDYSSNIVNGAYESMVLKGKTMANCIQEPSSKNIVLPYEFNEGQYVTINDTKESGALGVELKGQTLVNGITSSGKNSNATGNNKTTIVSTSHYVFDFTQNDEKTKGNVLFKMFGGGFKESTQYTIDYWIYENTMSRDDGNSAGKINLNSYNGGNVKIPSLKIGHFKEEVTTPPTSTQTQYGYIETFSTCQGKLDIAFLIREGHGLDSVEEHFEGMASCKMPILHTVGKNLLNLSSDTLERLTINGGTGAIIGSNTRCATKYIKATPKDDLFLKRFNTDYKVAVRYYYNDMLVNKTLNGNGNFISDGNLKVDSSDYYNQIRLIFAKNNDSEVTPQEVSSQQIMLTSSRDDVFEPYKSSILSLPEEVVLRSLPNGVCDTFNTRTGVYTQRIGQVVLDGSDSVNDWMFSASNNTFRTSFNKHGIIPFQGNTFVHVISDKYTTLVYKDDWNSGAFVSMDTYNRVVFRDDRFSSLTDWHNSLKQNAITVQYVLETPVTTKINLPSTLKSWNTTTHIYSEIPENTLYPILSHSNPTYPVILKPSTKYSIVANSYSNNHTNSTINFNLGGATASTTVGNRVTAITTPSTLSNELLTMSGRGNKLNNVMVIEGDVVGDEPYFEGICDCKSPILLNCGKNLFDGKLEIGRINQTTGENQTNSNMVRSRNFVEVKPSTTYTLSYEIDNGLINVAFYGSNKEFLGINLTESSQVIGGSLGSYKKILTTNNTHYLRFYSNSALTITDTSFKSQLEESPTPTTYEPYKSNILHTPEEIVLRSLPNGVCDTLNVETGEYAQRIGEVVFDGSEDENWRVESSSLSCTKFVSYVDDENRKVGGSLWCNAFNGVASGEHLNTTRIGIGGRVVINTDKALTSETFKQWLSQNPITVQYEFATPIVTTIDIQGFPYAYTNGHVQLSSGSIEQSLTPKVEYSVATNRNGQIRSNQKMVERHQKQLDRLQAMILTNLVNTQYEQTLTNLKYDLKNVREEVK